MLEKGIVLEKKTGIIYYVESIAVWAHLTEST